MRPNKCLARANVLGDLDRRSKSPHQGLQFCFCQRFWLRIRLQLETNHRREFAYFQALSANYTYRDPWIPGARYTRIPVENSESEFQSFADQAVIRKQLFKIGGSASFAMTSGLSKLIGYNLISLIFIGGRGLGGLFTSLATDFKNLT